MCLFKLRTNRNSCCAANNYTDLYPASLTLSHSLKFFILPVTNNIIFFIYFYIIQFSSVAQPCPTLCDLMNCSRPPCPSPTPGVHSNSRPSRLWCHPAISSSVVPLSSCLQSLPGSESFPMSQHIACGGQTTGVSASASLLPKNTQDWSPLEWSGWIFL